MKDLSGKTAFITGGASGIGLGMAHAFAEAGMNIVIADVEGEKLDQAAAEIGSHGTQVQAIELDVSDRAAMHGAAEQAEARFGKIHLLCNNAGVGSAGAGTGNICDI